MRGSVPRGALGALRGGQYRELVDDLFLVGAGGGSAGGRAEVFSCQSEGVLLAQVLGATRTAL